jgi:hypothetical protein
MARTGEWDGGLLREHRKRFGLTQDALAGELIALSARLYGVPAAANDRLVRAWERSEKRPGPSYQRLLCEVFGATPAELGFRAALPGEIEPGGSVPAEDDDVRRRSFLELIGSAMLTHAGQQLDGVRRGLDVALGHVPDAQDVEEWERTAHAYSHDLGPAAPSEILPNLLEDFDEIRHVIERAPAPVQRRLIRVAGQLAALTAHTVVGVGQPQAARRWWRTAKLAADRAGDPELAAYVRGQQAVQALYGGYLPAHVIELADVALGEAQGTPGTGAVSALAARAQALALMGRAGPARAALRAVDATFDRLPDAVRDGTPSFGWPEYKLRHVQSFVHTHVGDTARAQDAQDQALALYPALSFRGPTQVRLHRARCLIGDGDVTEGARYAAGVLAELPAQRRGDGFIARVARDALAAVPEQARALPAVSAYREVLAG